MNSSVGSVRRRRIAVLCPDRIAMEIRRRGSRPWGAPTCGTAGHRRSDDPPPRLAAPPPSAARPPPPPLARGRRTPPAPSLPPPPPRPPTSRLPGSPLLSLPFPLSPLPPPPEVNVVDAEPLPRAVQRLADMGPAVVEKARPVFTAADSELGRKGHPAATAFLLGQELADHLLAKPIAIDIRGVPEIDAEFERPRQRPH